MKFCEVRSHFIIKFSISAMALWTKRSTIDYLLWFTAYRWRSEKPPMLINLLWRASSLSLSYPTFPWRTKDPTNLLHIPYQFHNNCFLYIGKFCCRKHRYGIKFLFIWESVLMLENYDAFRVILLKTTCTTTPLPEIIQRYNQLLH